MTRNVAPATSPPSFPAAAVEVADSFPSSALLPEQFFTAPPKAEKGQGEPALIRAVLEDAIFVSKRIVMHPSVRGGLAQEAEEWFRAEDDCWPFSFYNICYALGLNPDYIRLGVKRWRQQGQPQRQRRAREAVASQQTLSLAA